MQNGLAYRKGVRPVDTDFEKGLAVLANIATVAGFGLFLYDRYRSKHTYSSTSIVAASTST
jgi:hypothetical protein